jgi:hypothetical protein
MKERKVLSRQTKALRVYHQQTSLTRNVKEGKRSNSSGRATAQQVHSPEFKSQ